MISAQTPTSLQTSPSPTGGAAATNPAGFKNPHSFGNKVARLLWGWVWVLLFRPTPPRLMAGWRRFLLTLFGAKVSNAYIHNTVEIWAPWKLKVGRDTFIDRDTNLYNTYGTVIGDRCVISRGVMLCSGSHDYTKAEFPLIGGTITVGSDVWIAAEAFVSPGIKIADGVVVGARAVVIRDPEPFTVIAGNPATMIQKREIRG